MIDDLIDKIDALKGRSKKKTLANLMPKIDAKIRQGVSHDEILTALYESGFDVNVNTFRSALYRYRRIEREKEESGFNEQNSPPLIQK